jgi:hypothetical protein
MSAETDLGQIIFQIVEIAIGGASVFASRRQPGTFHFRLARTLAPPKKQKPRGLLRAAQFCSGGL